jgi:acyl-ACP thioesterase
MNHFGEASPTTMLALLEEAAAEHCYVIDYSLYQLMNQNIGWVLVSGIIKMERYPRYKEKITIRTWLSNYSAIRGLRENIIYDGRGEVIGRARGLWVFFDIARRRPIRILEDIKNKWSSFEQNSLDYNINRKIKALNEAELIKEYEVNRFDVDTNQHVNNIRYFHWVMDSIPEEMIDHYDLHIIDGRFIGEAHYGDDVVSLTHTGEIPNSFQHTIKTKEEQKICATAISHWRKR